MARPEVTVVVAVKDRRDRMAACLESILDQDHPSFEVLILDNMSTDGTAERCRARAASARVPVRVEVVEGTLGRVRNRARALAGGRVIAFTDSDCTPQPGWLRAGVNALAADERIGVVCGRTIPPQMPARPWARLIEVREFSWRFETCNVFYRAEALRGTAGFDEVVGDGWEDTAGGYAVLAAGWRAAFARDAVVHHDVTYPGFWWHIRREQRHASLARVVKRYPEIRRRLMFGRVFFDRRSAAFFVAATGLALGRRIPAARRLALPYVPFMLRRVRPWRMAQVAILDASINVAMVRGAVRYRTFLL